MATTCMSYFTTGGPDKEHGTNKPPPTGRTWKRSKGDTSPYVLSTFQNLPCWNLSWLRDAQAIRNDLVSEWLARDNPETNPSTKTPEMISHVAEQSSWIPMPSCAPARGPFPIKSHALWARVSSLTIHSYVLDKSPLLGLGKGSPLTVTFQQRFPNHVIITFCFVYYNQTLVSVWHSGKFRKKMELSLL